MCSRGLQRAAIPVLSASLVSQVRRSSGGQGVPAEPLPAEGDGALRAPHPAGPVLPVCAQVLESAREVGPTEVTWLARRAPE